MEKNKINQFGAIIAASTILMGFRALALKPE